MYSMQKIYKTTIRISHAETNKPKYCTVVSTELETKFPTGTLLKVWENLAIGDSGYL